jgi:hypothetical protein
MVLPLFCVRMRAPGHGRGFESRGIARKIRGGVEPF